MNKFIQGAGFGLDINLFVDQEEAEKYLCCMCWKILKNPLQIHTADPTRACYSCYTDNIR